MQKLSKNLKVWLYTAFILTGLAVVLLTVALFTGYNTSSNYFQASLPFSIFKGLGVSAVVIAILSFVLTPKGKLNGDSPLTLPVVFPSAFLALILFGGGMILLGSLLGLSIVNDVFTGVAGTSTFILVLGAVFSFLAVVYFIFNCFPEQNGKLGERHALFGFAAPIAAAAYIAISYFDIRISMNAPIKLMFHLSMIFFMVWSLYELRIQLKKPMPRMYFALGILAMFFSAAASLPWLIASLAGVIKSPVYPTYILYNLISLAVFCYVTVRLIVYVQARDIFERIAEQTPPEAFEEEAEENSEDQSRKDI